MRSDVTRIRVPGEQPYDVVVGERLLDEISAQLPASVVRVAVIHPRSLAPTGEAVRNDLQEQGLNAIAIEVPDAEAAKSSQVAAFCWSVLGQNRFTRTDAIVAVGGGATTDLGGFVAATWLRGIAVVQVPTTLLGMVDAAVGGKTGINTEEGKNLVGAFHPPVGVVCDLTTLATLPRDDYVAGVAEAVKVGFTHDRRILELVESDFPGATSADGPYTAEIITRAVRVKAEVVGEDLRDSGSREFLNYGHTLAHAIERHEGFSWRHGAAVSVGLMFAAELGRLSGRLSSEVADRHRTILGGLGLPTTYRQDAWPALYDAMRVDKKSRGDTLRFIILDDLEQPGRLDGPDPGLLSAAFAEVAQ